MVTKGKERIAIEIETGKSNIEANLNKCREAGFEKIVIVHTKGLMSKGYCLSV